jgi:hypothetical protein
MVVQWIYGSWVAGGLHRDTAREGVAEGQVNKTDRNDVRVIAQMMHVNLFRSG